MRIKKIGLPYMGSKRKLAENIIETIIENHTIKHGKPPKYLFDLFGGGGAISLEAIQHHNFKKVIYNELNYSIVALLRDIVLNGITEKYTRWVTREEFQNNKNNLSWYGGFLQACWSFGNNQRSYLYGRDREETYKFWNDYILDDCLTAKKELEEFYNSPIPAKTKGLFVESPTEFRKRINREWRIRILDHYTRIELLKKITYIGGLEKISIYNHSFDDVKIDTPIDETVIYLDPPYLNTEKYKEKSGIDIKSFIKNSKHDIYLSEYENHYNMQEIASFNHRSTLNKDNNNKKVIERVFYHEALRSK